MSRPKMCVNYVVGKCKYKTCTFSHSFESMGDNYKKRMCNDVEHCRYGLMCNYAHTQTQLDYFANGVVEGVDIHDMFNDEKKEINIKSKESKKEIKIKKKSTPPSPSKPCICHAFGVCMNVNCVLDHNTKPKFEEIDSETLMIIVGLKQQQEYALKYREMFGLL